VYLSEKHDVYEEWMRAEFKSWEEEGNVTDSGRDGQPPKHCHFSKPVICWCLYHVNKSHREWAQYGGLTAEHAAPFAKGDWQLMAVGPAHNACHAILHISHPHLSFRIQWHDVARCCVPRHP